MTSRMRVFLAKLRALFGQQRSQSELEDEIRLHIQTLWIRICQ